MPNFEDVEQVSCLSVGSDIDPHHLLNLPVRSFKYKVDGGVPPRFTPGLLLEDIQVYYPALETDEWCLVPAMLWLIQEMHEEIQNLKKKVGK